MKSLLKLLLFGIPSGFVMLGGALFEGWWYSGLNATSIAADRITSGSNAIIQLDSFVVAGFIVGFFYFWERLESHFAKQGEGEPLSIVIALLLPLTVISFVTSGLIAVAAILTAGLSFLRIASQLLVFGVWTVFLVWFSLQMILEEAERKKGVKAQ